MGRNGSARGDQTFTGPAATFSAVAISSTMVASAGGDAAAGTLGTAAPFSDDWRERIVIPTAAASEPSTGPPSSVTFPEFTMPLS
jgi:hypothetical protein